MSRSVPGHAVLGGPLAELVPGTNLKSELVLLQTRRNDHPRSSREHHSNPTKVLYRFGTSMSPGVWARPTPSETPTGHPLAPLGTPRDPWILPAPNVTR